MQDKCLYHCYDKSVKGSEVYFKELNRMVLEGIEREGGGKEMEGQGK